MAKSWKNAMWPSPVYVATFDDNTVGRCSFWSHKDKPFDFDAGRAGAAVLFARPEQGEPLSPEREAELVAEMNRCNLRAARAGMILEKIKATSDSMNNAKALNKIRHFGATFAAATDRIAAIQRELAGDVARSFFKNYPARTIIDGYVEHDDPTKPWVRVRDPLFDGTDIVSLKAARKNRLVTMREAIAALEAGDHAAALALLKSAA